MSEAPERIWAVEGWVPKWSPAPFAGGAGVEYVRADRLEAEVARLREAALQARYAVRNREYEKADDILSAGLARAALEGG